MIGNIDMEYPYWKKLAPDFEALARDLFSAEPDILVAKIDAVANGTMKPAKEMGVDSFPEILFFPQVSKDPVRYHGDHSFHALHDFLNERTGAQRRVGGVLNKHAGASIAGIIWWGCRTHGAHDWGSDMTQDT